MTEATQTVPQRVIDSVWQSKEQIAEYGDYIAILAKRAKSLQKRTAKAKAVSA